MSKITTIMYHYVRKIKGSNHPNIEGIEISDFKRQLDYLQKNFTILDPEKLKNIKSYQIPNSSCLLTFDDGIKDHIKNVLPELVKRKIKACFFPIGAPTLENKALDAHLVHFILEKEKNIDKLLKILHECLENENYTKKDIHSFWLKAAIANKYDNKKVMYFKRMLQKLIPLKLRYKIVEKIFVNTCKISVKKFAKYLYMSLEDIKKLQDSKMLIGSHTFNHYWLNSLSYNQQKKEINESVLFMKEITNDLKNLFICYPYGAYNSNTIEILKKEKNFILGFTTKTQKSDLNSNLLKLSRYDTNDFPK